MEEIPITGLEELERHLQFISENQETPLNAKLFDEVELQLTGMWMNSLPLRTGNVESAKSFSKTIRKRKKYGTLYPSRSASALMSKFASLRIDFFWFHTLCLLCLSITCLALTRASTHVLQAWLISPCAALAYSHRSQKPIFHH